MLLFVQNAEDGNDKIPNTCCPWQCESLMGVDFNGRHLERPNRPAQNMCHTNCDTFSPV